MNNDKGQIIIRKATSTDARQIAEIIVEDWKNAYKGIIDDDFLDSMDVEERHQRESQRYQLYTVAAVENNILGLTWNEMTETDESDCEIIALYVRYNQRKSGIGKILFQNSVDVFRASGKKKMIIWCLKNNYEARKFYEKMGGKEYTTGTHKWGNRDYDMISYIYHLDDISK
ncbi:MAG: GNAT family N-acetyltransferase [Lachnospiraceae bacterium]|nr:GNAT family N-acetyltransferase [Lachnospiraceae bacterium]